MGKSGRMNFGFEAWIVRPDRRTSPQFDFLRCLRYLLFSFLGILQKDGIIGENPRFVLPILPVHVDFKK